MLRFLTHRLTSLLSLHSIDEDSIHSRITSQAYIDAHNHLRSTSDVHPSLQERRDCLSLTEVEGILLLLTLKGEVYNTRSGKLLMTGVSAFRSDGRELLLHTRLTKNGYWYRSSDCHTDINTDNQPVVASDVDYLAVTNDDEPCYVVSGVGFIRWVDKIDVPYNLDCVNKVRHAIPRRECVVYESKIDLTDPVRFCFITQANDKTHAYYVQDYSIIHAEVCIQTIRLTVVNTFTEKIQNVQVIGDRYVALLEDGRLYADSETIEWSPTTVAIGRSGKLLRTLTDSGKVKTYAI